MTTTPIVQASASKVSFPTSTTDSLPLPASIAANDLLVLFVAIANSVTVSTPAGWTLHSSSVTGPGSYLFYKVATGAEGATVDVTLSATTSSRVAISARISGVDTAGTPIAATGTNVAVAGGPSGIAGPVTGSATNTAVNQLMAVFEAISGISSTDIAVAPSTGYTEIVDAPAYGGYRQASLSVKDLATTIGANSVSIPLSGNVNSWYVRLLVLNPVPDTSATHVTSGARAKVGIDGTVIATGTVTPPADEPPPPDTSPLAAARGNATLGFRAASDCTITFGGGAGLSGDQFEIGDLCEVTVTFVDDRDGGRAKDPTAVTMKVRATNRLDVNGDVIVDSVVYGVDGALVRVGEGVYRMDQSITHSGQWYFRAEGTGALISANTAGFVVPDDPFYPAGHN